jgi:primosomal protein N' (replication factor Y)
MPERQSPVIHVALPVPVRRLFDYILADPALLHAIRPGMRVKVPFGKTATRTGLVTEISTNSQLDKNRLKPVISVLDGKPLFDEAHIALVKWACSYYHHPVGEIFFANLPASLRQGKPVHRQIKYTWQLTAAGRQIHLENFGNAPRQARLIGLLKDSPAGISQDKLPGSNWSPVLRTLFAKGLVRKCEQTENTWQAAAHAEDIIPNPAQQHAIDTVINLSGRYQGVLLHGVTGSGKTAVYIEIIRQYLAWGKQTLIMVPEIGLAPQLVSRLQAHLNTRVAVMHSGLTDKERLQAWLDARDGVVSVVLGTRSAIWTPMLNPGVIIIDEEHDLSYKQQDGFRYSARDVAIMRGKMLDIPVVLGTATPSMESLQNVTENKYIQLGLPERTGNAIQPGLNIIDVRSQQMHGALSAALLRAVQKELENHQQVLLFLNKRGFSPVLMCHACGWTAKCRRCDIQMTYYKLKDRISCHHCDSSFPAVTICPECSGPEIIQVGHGTERLAETLAEIFPRARILRIDRDTTRTRGAMKEMVDTVQTGGADILVGTQMLAKGHHFPKLNLVGIVDADRGLFSADFRASEHMAQLIVQVSGRAGRESDTGTVLLQTHYPDHPLLLSLVQHGYVEFSHSLLQERRAASLPPYTFLVLLRAEDYQQSRVEKFLTEAKQAIAGLAAEIEVYGPVPAPIEKKAGRLRFQLLLQSSSRNRLQRVLAAWCMELEKSRSGKKVRWSLDVDPVDML